MCEGAIGLRTRGGGQGRDRGHDRDRGRGRGHDHDHDHGHGRGHCAYYQQLFDRVYDWCGYAHDRVLRAHDCGRLNRIVFITKAMLTSD